MSFTFLILIHKVSYKFMIHNIFLIFFWKIPDLKDFFCAQNSWYEVFLKFRKYWKQFLIRSPFFHIFFSLFLGLNMEQEDLDEFMKEVKDSFNRMLSNPTEAHSQFFEMLVATLLNLEQFDFILSKKGKMDSFSKINKQVCSFI